MFSARFSSRREPYKYAGFGAKNSGDDWNSVVVFTGSFPSLTTLKDAVSCEKTFFHSNVGVCAVGRLFSRRGSLLE